MMRANMHYFHWSVYIIYLFFFSVFLSYRLPR